MRILCFSSDENFSQSFLNHSDRFGWQSMLMPLGLISPLTVKEYQPNVVIFDWSDPSLEFPRFDGSVNFSLVVVHPTWSEAECGQALLWGADVLLPKESFSWPLLRASLAAVTRRRTAARMIARPDLQLQMDLDGFGTVVAGAPIDLTLTEFRILRLLADKTEGLGRREELQRRVFGPCDKQHRALDVHVCSLRKKLKTHGVAVESIRGQGYRLKPATA